MIFESGSVLQTREIGKIFAAQVVAGDVLGLIGGLGCGKTEFVRGFMEFFDARAAVRSPTFSLINIYQSQNFPIFHFDFYRLTKRDELANIGFDEYLSGGGVCCIEWADMFLDVLPEDTTFIRFSDTGECSRKIEIVHRPPPHAG